MRMYPNDKHQTSSNYTISATHDVSMLVISVRIKAISLRAFSRITFGSVDVHRKQFGANTIAKLDESIFVLATMSGWENCCRKRTKYVNTCVGIFGGMEIF